jgi:hypothetical protein
LRVWPWGWQGCRHRPNLSNCIIWRLRPQVGALRGFMPKLAHLSKIGQSNWLSLSSPNRWAILNHELNFAQRDPPLVRPTEGAVRNVPGQNGSGHLVDRRLRVRRVRTSLMALAIDSREYGRPDFVICSSIRACPMKRIAGLSGTPFRR